MSSSPLSEFNGVLIDGLDFCSKVYELFERIRQTEGGPSRLRMRASDVEKKLLEELLPICRYIQAKYQIGRYISVRWLSGSQQFDAEVHQSGAYIDKGYFPKTAHLEVTCVMHPKEYLNRELLDSGGVTFGLDGIRRLKKTREIISEPIIRPTDFIHNYSTLVLNQIKKKIEINYPADTSLIVQCTLATLYTPDEWELILIEVQRNLPNHPFHEIFMYDTVTEYSRNI